MSDIFLQENSPDAPAVEVVKTTEELQALKNVTLVVYGLQALSFMSAKRVADSSDFQSQAAGFRATSMA